MRRFLSILMLACLLAGFALPAAAEGDEKCTVTEGCNKGAGHDGDCFVPCERTADCTLANAHDGLCDALCDDTSGCLLKGGHAEPCLTELALAEDANINEVLASKMTLIDYLETKYSPNYHYEGGNIVLKLAAPAEGYGEVTVGAELDDGTLTLQGISGTKMTSLTIQAERVCVNGIEFSSGAAAPAIVVDAVSGCMVSNCRFPGANITFRLIQNADKETPVISLRNNVFGGNCNVSLLDNSKQRVGTWQSKLSSSKAANIDLNLGATVTEETNGNGTKIIRIQFAENVSSYSEKGWQYTFNASHSFADDNAFAALNHALVPSDVFALTKSTSGEKMIKIVSPSKGEYIVVNSAGPKVVSNKVSITPEHMLYLQQVTVSTKYANATVTLNGKKAPAAVNSGKLTFTLNGAGTYTIAEIKTTTVKTTSRKYTSYQDYFLITPAGFSNAVRYVKNNLVTLNCTEAGRRAISLPVASLAAAAEKGYSLLVKTKGAELTLDAAALKSLAQQARGTTVLLHYRSLNHKTLSTVGQASVQSHLHRYPNDNADLAFLVTATSDSETIEDLQKGTVTLKIPFIVLPGTEASENRVYALRTESVTEARETTVADGYLTTVLLDLTEHMVFQVGPPPETTAETTEATVETTVETVPPETEPETEPETTQPTEPAEAPNLVHRLTRWLLIGLSVMLAAICGVLAVVFLRNRRPRK